MAGMEDTEKSYGIVDRLLFYTLPVLFTLLLTWVLLTVFGYNVTEELLRAGNRIPVLSALLPDPPPTESEMRDPRLQVPDPNELSEEAARLRGLVSERDVRLAVLEREKAELEEKLAALQAEYDELQRRFEELTVSEEQYAAEIKRLADVYAGMSPGRAAPILESMTLEERVLLLREMRPENQTRILERMTPAVAAETSIQMKDVYPARDAQIAALQSRLAIRGDGSGSGGTLSIQELSQTFAAMAPQRAAAVLLAMAEIDSERVVSILRAMDERRRATLLDALADISEEETARLTARLG